MINHRMAKFKLTGGTILIFIAFGLMFWGLISPGGTHFSKALIVIICFIIMAFGAFVNHHFFREKVEGQDENDGYFLNNRSGFR